MGLSQEEFGEKLGVTRQTVSKWELDQTIPEVPVNECRAGECVMTSKGYIWAVKRYTDDMIALQGCGTDEYIYRRDDRKEEAFIF